MSLQEALETAIAAGSTTSTTTDVTMDQTSLQLAYTVGGATIGIADVEVDNADYTTKLKHKQLFL